MFYAKWFAQVLLIVVLIASVVLLAPPIGIAAPLLFVAPLWSIWLLANLMLHLMRKTKRDGPVEHASQAETNNGTHLTPQLHASTAPASAARA
jgi:cytochrome c-type biogenesis protein CcmH/NrfF